MTDSFYPRRNSAGAGPALDSDPRATRRGRRKTLFRLRQCCARVGITGMLRLFSIEGRMVAKTGRPAACVAVLCFSFTSLRTAVFSQWEVLVFDGINSTVVNDALAEFGAASASPSRRRARPSCATYRSHDVGSGHCRQFVLRV